MKVLFTEQQKFDQWWARLLLGVLILIPIYGIYKQISLGDVFGDNPMSNTGLIVFLCFMLLFVIFLGMMQLTTLVTEKSINIKFFPFLTKTILWNEVQSAEVLNYGFVGGWGIRFSMKYGTVYNISGKMGLVLVLKNGGKVCIGTQRPEELKAVIEQVRAQG